MRMEVDMLDYAIGGVLSIKCENGRWQLIAFLLKSLNTLLEGAKFKFEIWTNYKNLEYFMKAQKLNRRQAIWVLYLSRFDFTLKHILGIKMGKTNRLSRRLD